jgi:hypothetical protein
MFRITVNYFGAVRCNYDVITIVMTDVILVTIVIINLIAVVRDIKIIYSDTIHLMHFSYTVRQQQKFKRGTIAESRSVYFH